MCDFEQEVDSPRQSWSSRREFLPSSFFFQESNQRCNSRSIISSSSSSRTTIYGVALIFVLSQCISSSQAFVLPSATIIRTSSTTTSSSLSFDQKMRSFTGEFVCTSYSTTTTSSTSLYDSLDPMLIPDAYMEDPSGSGTPPCVIKVLGVGGGGGNAVNRMIQTNIEGVSFWAINTDAQALAKSLAPNVLNIGRALTRGLGAGGDPGVGRRAALENNKELMSICAGADMVFITAGMGGGTGSGAAPILAEIAKQDCGCLTVGVVTKPFAFEGRKRMKQAESAIEDLRQHVDTVIVVSNDRLLRIVPDNTPVTDAFLVADDILRQGVIGISEIILKTGLVNVDFADVRSVMTDAGTALMGVGRGDGKDRATKAAMAAISSPLLDFPIQKAKRIVFNVVGGDSMGLQEINEASEVIYENADDNANIIFGALVDPEMGEEISLTVLACDFETDVLKAAANANRMVTKDGGGGGGVVPPPENLIQPPPPTIPNQRDPNFYKERRKNTQSPLGPDASLEETRVAITRGFKKPVDPRDQAKADRKRMSKRSRVIRFIKRLFGGGN